MKHINMIDSGIMIESKVRLYFKSEKEDVINVVDLPEKFDMHKEYGYLFFMDGKKVVSIIRDQDFIKVV